MSDLNIVEINNDDIQIIIDGAVVSWSEIYGDPTKCASLMKLLEQLLKKKVDSNDPIEPATKCKITYDEKGLVTLGEDLTIEDLPPLHLENIIDVIATTEEVNILSGIEVTTEELNKLKGLIATSTELNILSGIDVTTEELNKLKGLLVSAVTLNLLDGIRSNVQEQIDSKQNNLGFTAENIANKTDNYEVSDSNLYPSTLALKNGLDTKQDKLTAEQLNNLNKGATIDDISMLQQNKVDSNAPIMPATKCKITYDEKGLVTLGEDLEDTDIPTIPFAKLNDVNVTNVEINRLKGLTVEAPELNQLEGVSDNVQNQINNINGMIPKEANEENKLADKTYVVNWVDDHAGYFVSKDAKNTPFSSYAELLSTIHFYNNGRPKRISDNDFTVVTCDETRNNAVIMYAWIKDEIYNEGHWKYQYKVSNYYDELNFNWGTIIGNINDQTDLVNALNKKQNVLVNQQNIKSIDGNSLLGNGNLIIDKYTKSEANNKFAEKTEIIKSYEELNNLPQINNIELKGNKALADLGIQPAGDYVQNDSLSSVATSGSYNDLKDKPTIPEAYTLPVATDTVLGGVKVDNNTITIEDGVISTHVEFNKNYNTLTNKPQINGIELSGNKTLTELGVQPAGNYLTSIPAEYVTNSELNAKGYLTSIPSEYITETELNGKGYLTGIPAEYITETELNGKGYLTSVPEGYVQNSDLAQVAISGSYNDLEDKPTIPTPYILPTASTNVLGGVKVDGTSITITDGVIKASSTSVPIATTDVAGIIKPNSLTFEVSEDGTLTDKSAGSNCYIYGLNGIGTDDITNSTGTTTLMPVGRLRNYDYERGDRLKVGDMLIDLKGNVAKVDRVNTAVLPAGSGPYGVNDSSVLIKLQVREDDNLTTTSKEIVGAINELLTKIESLEARIATLEGGGEE